MYYSKIVWVIVTITWFTSVYSARLYDSEYVVTYQNCNTIEELLNSNTRLGNFYSRVVTLYPIKADITKNESKHGSSLWQIETHKLKRLLKSYIDGDEIRKMSACRAYSDFEVANKCATREILVTYFIIQNIDKKVDYNKSDIFSYANIKMVEGVKCLTELDCTNLRYNVLQITENFKEDEVQLNDEILKTRLAELFGMANDTGEVFNNDLPLQYTKFYTILEFKRMLNACHMSLEKTCLNTHHNLYLKLSKFNSDLAHRSDNINSIAELDCSNASHLIFENHKSYLNAIQGVIEIFKKTIEHYFYTELNEAQSFLALYFDCIRDCLYLIDLMLDKLQNEEGLRTQDKMHNILKKNILVLKQLRKSYMAIFYQVYFLKKAFIQFTIERIVDILIRKLNFNIQVVNSINIFKEVLERRELKFDSCTCNNIDKQCNIIVECEALKNTASSIIEKLCDDEQQIEITKLQVILSCYQREKTRIDSFLQENIEKHLEYTSGKELFCHVENPKYDEFLKKTKGSIIDAKELESNYNDLNLWEFVTSFLIKKIKDNVLS